MFLTEKKKGGKKKKKSKKKTRRAYYSGVGPGGACWSGRQAVYYPVLFPAHVFPHMKEPELPDPLDFDYSAAADFTDANPVGETEESMDEQYIQILTFDQDGKRVRKRGDSFNRARFRKALEDGIVRFRYRKVNGQLRDAYGTTNTEILRRNRLPDIKDPLRHQTHNIRYYDLEKQSWRSFRPEHLLVIYEKVISDESENDKKQ